jgi:hypothetical protein
MREVLRPNARVFWQIRECDRGNQPIRPIIWPKIQSPNVYYRNRLRCQALYLEVVEIPFAVGRAWQLW